MEAYGTLSDAKKAKKTGFKLNPKHEGWCTPMTKSTCTGKRRAFALTMKKHHGFHKAKET
jgi:hypothetical protein